MSRPLTLTSRSHPIAVWVYIGQGALAGLYLVGIARAQALTGFVDSRFAGLWATGMLIGAVTALAASLARRGRLSVALLGEATGAATLSLVNLTYIAALALAEVDAPTTMVMSATLCLATAHRAAQCISEVRRAARAVADPHPADPPPLAEVSKPREG